MRIMKKKLLIMLLSFCGAGAMAQAENNYLPFVEEGKSWVVTYLTQENTDSYKKIYIIKGDTIIGGVLYKKLFEKDRDLYLYAIREDGQKVYAISSTDKYGNPNTEEILWYDFNVNEGDKIETESSWLYVTGTDHIKINGVLRRRINIHQVYKNNPNENNGTGVWVEGIGSDLGPISPYSWGLDRGANSTMDYCSFDGQVIFNYSHFTVPNWGDGLGIEQHYSDCFQQSERVYDLQGRRLSHPISDPSPLKKGIYIENGRKRMVR